MRFYTKTHKHYCGIDLHARTMYICILDAESNTLLHRNIPCGLKHECLDGLRAMNITARTLIPGPDGIGRAASERAKVRIWSRDGAA